MTDQEKIKRIEILITEVSKAYKLAHVQVPSMKDLEFEASIVSTDLEIIPTEYLAQAYSQTRVHGKSSLPTSRAVVITWLEGIKPTTIKPLQIADKHSHSCRFCTVVAHRLKALPRDLVGHFEILMVEQEPSADELKCVRSTVNEKQYLRDYWNKDRNSPYKGLL